MGASKRRIFMGLGVVLLGMVLGTRVLANADKKKPVSKKLEAASEILKRQLELSILFYADKCHQDTLQAAQESDELDKKMKELYPNSKTRPDVEIDRSTIPKIQAERPSLRKCFSDPQKGDKVITAALVPYVSTVYAADHGGTGAMIQSMFDGTYGQKEGNTKPANSAQDGDGSTATPESKASTQTTPGPSLTPVASSKTPGKDPVGKAIEDAAGKAAEKAAGDAVGDAAKNLLGL